ncbi:hypothetical protein HU200_044840 [Digitaria exilis]|uniref:Trichome birefringence-like N-terminal domain-containing protein n=1 Tax=Digitaria exilis TaxID=1010633 RepID=A0A835EB51_9POAL|nr:hypothetical protein HU200_044840 [Digitaria exilis]
MERHRSPASSSSSYHCHLLRPRSLPLVSVASLSLSLLFTLILALRHGRPLHLPLAFATAPAPVLVGGGAYRGDPSVTEVEEAVLGFRRGDSVAEGVQPAVPGDLSVRGMGSATEAQETASGGGNGGAPANGEVLEGQEVEEAGNYSIGALNLAMDAKDEVVRVGGDGENLEKDPMSEKENPNSAEAKNISKIGTGSATATTEKLQGTESVKPFNFSTEASGTAMEVGGEFLQDGHVGTKYISPVQAAYAFQLGEQRESPDHSAGKNNAGSSPANSNKQDPTRIEEELLSKMDSSRSDAVHCDVYDGSWVFDETYPLYTSDSCPFVDEAFSCGANGRTDHSYMKWRWQPRHCNIPRFDARRMLEMLRGKRLVFIGDSINRNQWESMMCLLRTAVSDPARIHETRGRKITKEKGDYNFKFMDYNCSVEFHVTHFLVHEGKARIGQKRTKTLRIDTIDRSSSRWKGADVIVFNTAHWWSHHKTKAGVNYYQVGDHVHPHLDSSTAFQRALITWASWVDRYINSRQTRVFFRSSSPSHFSGGEWNSGGHCRESTMPLNDSRARPVPERNVIMEQVIKQMKTPVTILNITNLSGIRIDGHPSVYGRKAVDLTASSVQDCSHWCLPGVPDTWNELLFYHLVSSQEKDVTGD